MRTLERIQDRDDGDQLEPWEMGFLRSGEEPDARHAFLFSLLYETADWRQRWEAAADEIIDLWAEMPLSRRPVDWIRYLTDIGYISSETRAVLEAGTDPPFALSA